MTPSRPAPWKCYARTDATIISAIYEANATLAAWGPCWPEAIAITLPDPGHTAHPFQESHCGE
ncbi:tail protein X [Xylella fastidiosa subsp. multiplex]|uniref:hypothetical protein n=1 Tax=Xylella fastidiosa TaxID=2371 RepID=UPI0035D43C8A